MPLSIIPYNGRRPSVDPSAFIDPTSRLVGFVKVGRGSAVFYGSVLRAEEGEVWIGEHVAILEHCLVEAPSGVRVTIGDGSLISHRAVVHGASIGRGALVGIGAILLDGVEVGDEAMVAAGTVVPSGFKVEPRSLVAGVPARLVRRLSEDEVNAIESSLEEALRKAERYKQLIKL